jgi:hypothetical protein
MLGAPAELKISCTKPRANEEAMGIESVVWGGEKRCVLGKVGVGATCGLLSADLLQWCSRRRQGRAA